MKRRSWLQRLICPRCVPSGPAETPAVVAMLRRSTAALDHLSAEVRRIRTEMAADDNPVLGPPPRAPRKEHP